MYMCACVSGCFEDDDDFDRRNLRQGTTRNRFNRRAHPSIAEDSLRVTHRAYGKRACTRDRARKLDPVVHNRLIRIYRNRVIPRTKIRLWRIVGPAGAGEASRRVSPSYQTNGLVNSMTLIMNERSIEKAWFLYIRVCTVIWEKYIFFFFRKNWEYIRDLYVNCEMYSEGRGQRMHNLF